MKIVIDAMGGDNAPREIVLGALSAAKDFGVEIVLVGKGEEILRVLADEKLELPPKVEIADAAEVVEMCDDPATVIREKKNSSMAVGLRMVSEGYGDVFMSAGSTGALLTGSTLLTKRIRGIRRAALGSILPAREGTGTLLIDCGANVECTAEYLLQFAYMGSYYAGRMMGKENPRVALLNIGSEPTKGGALQLETYKLLTEAHDAGRLNFIGNVEGRDVMENACDVIVTDGYSGNILLKAIEGMGLFFAKSLKTMFYKNIGTKLAAALVKDGIDDIKKMMDYNEVGGAPLLGIAKPVFKIHGSAKAKTVNSAVRNAIKYVGSGIIDSVSENIDYMKIDLSEK